MKTEAIVCSNFWEGSEPFLFSWPKQHHKEEEEEDDHTQETIHNTSH